MSSNGIELAKKFSIVVGAVVLGSALLGAVWAAAVALTITPAFTQMISEERAARQAGDSTLAVQLQVLTAAQIQMSRDRLTLLAVLEAKSASERAYLLRQARESWQPKIYDRP